jgi:aerobic-type carbon monoxide dehydrogenase small subunit (CoxS/CutS family)
MSRPQPDISFTFNGVAIKAITGQTIAAALLDNDVREFRKTRFKGEPRSIFCGIGVCWDCVVTVNGFANQRSCLVEAVNGMVVTS